MDLHAVHNLEDIDSLLRWLRQRDTPLRDQWARGSTRFAPDHSHHILLQDTKTETEPRETYTCVGAQLI